MKWASAWAFGCGAGVAAAHRQAGDLCREERGDARELEHDAKGAAQVRRRQLAEIDWDDDRCGAGGGAGHGGGAGR